MKTTNSLHDYIAAGGKWESAENQSICRQLVQREVIHCASSIVSHFAQNTESLAGSGHDEEEIYALCQNTEDTDGMTIEECRDYISENGGTEPRRAINPWDYDREQIIEELTAVSIECRDDETDDTLRAALIANIDDETIDGLDEWRNAARETAQENPTEVYEHWIVSSWLAARLAERGETTGELFDFHIWGRCCTGQAIALDSVIASIAAEMGILHGQANDWSK